MPRPPLQAPFLLLALSLLLSGASCSRDVAPDYGAVGSFSLTERNGQKVTAADLRGKVWVASFVFTRCTGPCPQVTATVSRLQKELDLTNRENLRLVTFTVDPERDQPKELQAYAENFRAHPERWLFLTGKQEDIHQLLLKGFKVPVAEQKGGKAGEEFQHSTRLVVVDQNGHIRGYFSGLALDSTPEAREEFERDLKRLQQTVNTLLKEKP
jgi:protein SCO1